MIEIIIKNHLDSKLEEQVFLEKPSPSYGVYVVFEKLPRTLVTSVMG